MMRKTALALSLAASLLLSSGWQSFARTQHKKSDESADSKVTVDADSKPRSKRHTRSHERREISSRAEKDRDADSARKTSTNPLARLFHFGSRDRDEDRSSERKDRVSTRKRTEEKQRVSSTERRRTYARRFDDRQDDRSATEPRGFGSHAGMVYVHPYTRADGTYVHGYWRHRPGQ